MNAVASADVLATSVTCAEESMKEDQFRVKVAVYDDQYYIALRVSK